MNAHNPVLDPIANTVAAQSATAIPPAPSRANPVIEARGLVRHFGQGQARVHALKGVDLAIGPSEFCALCGPSGSGKSTLLNVLGLLDTPNEGQIIYAGQALDLKNETRLRTLRRNAFGFVFQNFNLVPTLSAVENVEMALFHATMPRRDKRAAAAAMLEKVGLGDRMKNRPNQLSGGQQQRVAVARALVRQPKLVFADEPTANLDAANAFALMDLMDDLRQQTGTSFITSTHDHRLMDRFTRIVALEDGKVTG